MTCISQSRAAESFNQIAFIGSARLCKQPLGFEIEPKLPVNLNASLMSYEIALKPRRNAVRFRDGVGFGEAFAYRGTVGCIQSKDRGAL